MSENLKWGSTAWRTHLRRSLAQRKRHGENIEDIEGLINYIEAKGPAKAEDTMKKITSSARKPQPRQKTTRSIVNASGRKIVSAPDGKVTPGEIGFFNSPTILRSR